MILTSALLRCQAGALRITSFGWLESTWVTVRRQALGCCDKLGQGTWYEAMTFKSSSAGALGWPRGRPRLVCPMLSLARAVPELQSHLSCLYMLFLLKTCFTFLRSSYPFLFPSFPDSLLSFSDCIVCIHYDRHSFSVFLLNSSFQRSSK